MEQDTINQRLNFLVESLAQSARAFSDAIGESPTNTHNYISGGRKPKPEYLKSLLLHYRNISAHWLLTGEGEPFLPDSPILTHETNANYVKSKNFSQNLNSGINTGTVGNTTGVGQSLSQEQQTALQRENELLRAQLADKERTIQILLSQQKNT
jgi:hypothetical protein